MPGISVVCLLDAIRSSVSTLSRRDMWDTRISRQYKTNMCMLMFEKD